MPADAGVERQALGSADAGVYATSQLGLEESLDRASRIAGGGATTAAGEPVAGARLTLDGEATAASDETGFIVVERPERPDALGVEGAEWELVPQPGINPVSGRFRDGRWWAVPVRVVPSAAAPGSVIPLRGSR
ncbi:MAG: hypothetical protein GY711_32720 [bacterium]|nr:hypothetical protein [bacterium]